MDEILTTIHKVIDEKVDVPFLLTGGDGFEEDLKYFAADVIAKHYRGEKAEGLACACQCFFNSRIAHSDTENMDALQVLLGDYYIGQIAGFDVPGMYEIFEQFADFIEEQTAGAQDLQGAGTIDLDRYEALFVQIAEAANE